MGLAGCPESKLNDKEKCEMDTKVLESSKALMEAARQAVFHARSRFLSPNTFLNYWDVEDMMQAAALVYWQSLHRGQHQAYAFVAASRAAAHCYAQTLVGHNPLGTVDLMLAGCVGGASGWSGLPEDGEESWLDEAELAAILMAARQNAASAHVDTIQTDVRIIRLLVQGYTNAGIAALLGTTEKSIRNRRYRIKRQLRAACQKMGIEPPEYPTVAQGGYKHQAAWKRMTT
jgi:DNA-binding CsgD family transcriptional regulator